MWRKIILIIILPLAALSAGAQTGLSVDTIFGDYGKKQGSVMIDLAKDVLGEHTRIIRYKCLIINTEAVSAQRIGEAAVNDFTNHSRYGNGVIIKQIYENGLLRSATYSLGKEQPTDVNQYILYSRRNDKTTLVYLTGHFSPDRLNGELNKLKNLFIKVNNKQIKLY